MLIKKDTALKVDKAVKSPKRKQAELILASAVGAIAVAGVILFMIGAVLKQTEKVRVYVAASNIECGTKIDDSNISKYIKKEDVPVEYLPSGYMKSKNSIKDMFINSKYVKGQVILKADCNKQEDILSSIENPIEVSLSVSKIDSAVGGILREGDFVNIYTMQSEGSGYKAVSIMKNAFITKALDSSGKRIDKSDKGSNATVLNIVIPMSVEKDFNQAVYNGNIRIGLIYNENGKVDVSEAGEGESTNNSNDVGSTENNGNGFSRDMTTADLINLMNSGNKNKALEYFGVEPIEVSGQLIATELTSEGKEVLTLEDNTNGYSVVAEFEHGALDINSVQTGQEVKIKGQIKVDSNKITLSNCEMEQ